MTRNLIKLNYDEELLKYNNELFSKLRDFGTKALNLWVPDEDLLLSIFGIISSVSSNGYNKVQIEVSKETIVNYYALIINQAKNFCNISSKVHKGSYVIQFDKIEIKDLYETVRNYQKLEKKRKKDKKLKIFKIKKGSKKILTNNIFDISSKVHKDENLFLINKNQIKYYIDDQDYIAAKNNKINFFVKLKKDNISSIKFSCEIENRSLLVKFAKIIISLPLHEAYEHGVMRFEHSIRKKNIKSNIKGIITPFVMNHFYKDLQIIMKDIFNKYKEKNQIIDKKNTFDQKVSLNWKQLSEIDKITKIKKLIFENSKNNNIKFNFIKIEDEVKILVDYKLEKKEMKDIHLYSSFLNLEKLIRKRLDKRLEVFYIYEKDANKLRQK